MKNSAIRGKTMKHNSTHRKTIARLLAIALMIGVCVLIIQAAVSTDDISSKVGVNNLGVAYSFDDGKTGTLVGAASFTPNPSSKTIGLTVKSYSAWSKDNCTPGSLTLTLTNNYDSKAELSFDYTVSKTYGTWSVGTESGVMSRTGFLVTLDGHSDFTITITTDRSKTGAKNGVVMNITNIQLVEQVFNVNTTFLPPEQGGSYSVDGTAITSEKIIPNKSNYVYSLAATPATGYVFAGWKNADTGAYFSGDASISRAFTENSRIQPVFVPEGSAQFGVGSQRFYNLNVANKYAVANDKSKIVLLQSGPLLAENYEISKGVTLLIPYDQSGMENETTHEATPATVDSANSNRTAFRTLTIPSGATLTVNGAINVDGQVLSNGSIPTGPYGLITLHRGSAIVLNDGGKLYCWGYINGDGVVSANANSAVYECFQLAGWRGGSDSLNMNNNSQKVFPVNQYYVQNVEARLEFNYGASEYVFASVTVNVIVATAYASTTEVYIGKDKGMFRPDKEGSVLTKKYVPATDRTEFEVKGDMTINTMTLDLVPKLGSVSFSAFAVKLATGSYVLPINSGFSVNIYSGTTTIAKDQDIALLPGAEFTVSEGAEFVAASNMYVYDHDQWAGQKYAYGFYGYGACDLAPVGYSTTNGTSVIRSANKEGCLKDAVIDVNGTMTIKGNIYTTSCDNNVPGVPDTAKGQVSCGAYIFSTGGNGVVVFNNKYPDTIPTTHQYQQASKTYSDIACNPAWLRNGDGTYTETKDAQAGWSYKYDTVQQRWYRFRVDYQFNGKNIGYDLITTDTATRDVRNYVSDGSSLVGTVTSGMADTPTISGGTLTVTGVRSDCTINIEGVAASYTPYFVLNEHQYSVYLSYGGTEITNKVTIDKKTYYVVKSCGTMAFGTALSAPSYETMGVSEDSHNSITWFLEDVTTGAQQFMDTVPSGTTKGGPVYIYGIYNGAVAHNSYTNEYYTNLKDAIVDLPVTGSATLTMYANCGTFEDESKTASYSLSANITFNVNGKEAWGSLVNNGTLTLVDAKGGKIITEAVSTNGSLQNYASVVRNNGTLTMDGVTLVGTQTTNDYFAGVMNYTGGKIVSMKDCNVSVQRGYGLCNYNGGAIDSINDTTLHAQSSYGVYNYGGTITKIDGLTMTGRYGINNRNIRGNSYSTSGGATIAAYGRIGTITNVNIDVRQYAIYNGALIDEISGNSNLTATPASEQVPMSGYTESNTPPAYTVYNSNAWYYDTSIWRRTDDTSSGVLVRTDEYTPDNKPTIGKITGNVTITAVNTSNSVEHGYAVENQGRIKEISGNAVIQTYVHSGNSKINYSRHALRNESGGIVDLIGGNVTISAGDRGIYNAGSETIKNINTYETTTATTPMSTKTTYRNASKIVSINGDSNGSGVTIEAVKNQYGILNYAAIGDITGKVTIKANNGSYGLSNQGDSANSYYEYTLSADKTVRKYYYERISASVGTIGGGSSKILISSKSGYALINAGTINAILAGVTIQATTGSNNMASLYNSEGRQKTYTEWRTNLGTNAVTSGNYDTKFDRYYTYEEQGGYIGKIEGNVKVTTGGYYALSNYGTIGSIRNGVQLTAKNHYALYNWAHYDNYRRSINYYHGTSAFSVAWADRYFDETTVDYTRKAASIGAIDGVTIQANSYAIHNGGDIGSIANSVIKATGERAVNNTGGTTLYYLDTTVKNLTEANTDQLVTYDSTTGKYSFTTKNREVKYGGGTIGLLGGNNKISGTTNVILNSGKIEEINNTDGQGNALQKSTITATSGYGIYNYKGFTTARSMTAGTDAVLGYTSATIGTIANTEVTAVSYSLLNGDTDGSYTAIAINELGAGNVFKSSSNACVYDRNYATIGKISGGSYTGTSGCVLIESNSKLNEITGGTFTATSTGTYALKNNNTSAAIAISVGPTFLGGTDSRSYTIYDADTATRQTYPEGGYTLSNKPNKDGYYYITNEFTIKFDGNEPESGKLSGSTNSMTVPMSETTVTLPDCGFTATGWKFVGWSLKKDTAASSTELLKTSATQGQLGNPAAGDEVILYAIWQPDKVYSVTVSWSKGLEYTYIPNEYTWNATEMRYEHTREAGWIGANDSRNPTVTISNGGDKTDVTYGHINAGIQYTPNATIYNGFTMDFLVDNKSVGKGSATLATKLAPKNSVTTTMKLEGTPVIGMDTGKPITIGTVALTLTTAD